MGQVLGREGGIIPYDVNGWRRLSFTYLNAISETGEIVLDENGVPVDPRTLTGAGTPASLRRASRPASRQSSFSSGGGKQYDTHESLRVGGFPLGERPVLQEYQPKGKTSSPSNQQPQQNQQSQQQNEQQQQRAQSPKSSTSWNSTSSSSEEQTGYGHGYSKQVQLKQIDPPSYANYRQQSGGKSLHHGLLPPNANGFGSRQSSGRTAGGETQSSGKSITYLPYNDYYLDRRLRGQHHLYNGGGGDNGGGGGGGPPTYSDFSGYSSSGGRHYRNNFRRRRTGVEHRPTGFAKWLFVLAALANVAATIWGSGVYLHLASKKLEIGETIQDKNVHMSETARHAWQGVILGSQVLTSLLTLAAIYAAFAEHYCILWWYTLAMAAYGLLGAVSDLARGSYTAWILPLICVQMAIVLCHHVAVNRANRLK